MTVRLSSPDKVLWPEVGVTKAELAEYYAAVAARLLPQVKDRPLTLKRHNSGVAEEGFFVKNLPASAPGWIRRHEVWTETSQRTVAYPLADTPEDLRWFAQQNAVELHAWFSRVDRPDRPDTLAFDLDPPEGGGGVPVGRAACWLRDLLDELGLSARVKTSGKKGVHLYVSVERRYEAGVLRGLALAVGRSCATRHPDALTVEMRKADRGGRLLIDWSRPGPAQTLAVAWSPRAHPLATVSTPLRWEEVTDDLDPTRFTVRTVLDREDPWAEAPVPQRVERARDALVEAGFEVLDRSPRARTTS